MLLSIFYLAGILLGSTGSNAESLPLIVNHRVVGEDSLTIYKKLNLSIQKVHHETGTLNLENGGNSLVTRLWLLREAKKTIDLQYFSFARNLTGLIASEYLIQAAERGVKIRLIIDELSGKLNKREIKILDRHKNIEVRVYNAGLKLGRVDKKIKYASKNHNRLLRRMHNKTFTVDGQASILGGRNISDEYFDYGDKYNFRDRDVILFGGAVKEVTKSFNEFWNSKYTVTVEELVGKSDQSFSVDALFAKFREFSADTAKFSERMRARIDSFPVIFKKSVATGEFQWTNVSFVSDVPGKNEDRKDRKGGVCEDTVLFLIRNAKVSIDVQSPYFITTDEARKLLKETVDRGVKVRILTNSLAAIDNNVAFSPYKRDRKKNLKTGIEIYEFRPDAAIRFEIMSPDVQAELHYDPVFGLHSKSIVIDGKTIVIGSYNLEPRSANLNTECIAVIRDEKFTENVSKFIQEEFLPQNSWRITPDFNPDKKASFMKRVRVFFGHVVPKQTL
jgi:putative cardiolipin synthase